MSRVILNSLTRERLLQRCVELEKLLVSNAIAIPPTSFDDSCLKKKKKNQKPFDFSKYSQRKVALKIAYLGEKYHGLAMQSSTPDTVEAHLLAALLKTKLIEKDFATAQYSRSGRTDKGVSAFGQVVSLYVRSAEPKQDTQEEGGELKKKKAKVAKDINYVKMLNGVLPLDIRVIDWAPVDKEFDARFSCTARHYKYFFHKETHDIDVCSSIAIFPPPHPLLLLSSSSACSCRVMYILDLRQ
eukprot:m.55073 g.55073  ORF g.55073 m.55073 type:complete len:242 (+) comp7737_c0_seq2:66-791(+)